MSISDKKLRFEALTAIALIALTIVWIIYHRAPDKVEYIELTGSELYCKLNLKHDNYTGYYQLKGQSYHSYHNYDSCEEFISLMDGKIITGKYLKSNNRLVELRVGSSLYTDNSTGMQILVGIFYGVILYAVFRKPILWLRDKIV